MTRRWTSSLCFSACYTFIREWNFLKMPSPATSLLTFPSIICPQGIKRWSLSSLTLEGTNQSGFNWASTVGPAGSGHSMWGVPFGGCSTVARAIWSASTYTQLFLSPFPRLSSLLSKMGRMKILLPFRIIMNINKMTDKMLQVTNGILSIHKALKVTPLI